MKIAQGMPMPDYLAHNALDASLLKILAQGTPAHLKWHREHPEPSTREQDFGTVVHVAVFQPHDLDKCCYIRPRSYPSSKGETRDWNANSNWCKEWIVKHRDKPVLSSENYAKVLLCRDAILARPAVQKALSHGGKFEQSLFVEHPETKIELKARLDWDPPGNALFDLKVTGIPCGASPDNFSRQMVRMGYDISAAFHLDVANWCGRKKTEFVYIVCENEPPFCVAEYCLSATTLETGRGKYNRLLRKYLQAAAFDTWPGYSPNIEYIDLPGWAKRQEFNAMLLEDAPSVPALTI